MTLRERLIRDRINELQTRLVAAQARGDTESYVSLCRFRLEDMEGALQRELQLQSEVAGRPR